MPRITVIGKNSFLAQHLANHPDTVNWTFLEHDHALSETDWIKSTDAIINCAYHPDMRTQPYSPIKDIDFMLGGYIQKSDIHYIMLSSRAVYGSAPDDLMLREDIPATPDTVYGQNKLHSEQALQDLLPPGRLTILRNSNIFGSEYGRSTFFGMMITNLKDNGVLKFNIAADAQRDFLPATIWADHIVNIANAPQGGLYNLGAGFGVSTEDMAQMLIKNHGKGNIQYTDHSYDGQFILDITKAQNTFHLSEFTMNDLKSELQSLSL